MLVTFCTHEKFLHLQLIFSKKLTRKQWLSLVILTIGCMVKQVNFTMDTDEPNKTDTKDSVAVKHDRIHLSWQATLIFVQATCSCLAGVYNEYLLKKTGSSVDIFMQNIFMYMDSILCNLLLLVVNGGLADALTFVNVQKVFRFKVLIVMINNAAIGIITSFFLMTLNSILKTYASALELILTAVLSYVFFGIPIYYNTVISIVTVLFAVYLYSKNPVANAPQKPSPEEVDEDEQVLVMDKV